MTKIIRPCAGAILATVTALVLTGCDLQVVNPGVIDAGTFDPTTDARTLSLSAQTNFYAAYANVVNFTGYFSGEAWVGATRQETNDFGRRVITPANLDINPNVWAPLSLAIASNEDVLDILDRAGVGAGDINAARSALYSGFALVLMAESFCEGVMRVGPPMTTAETLDSAIVRFDRAIQEATAATGDEAVRIANSARVGLARAYLQKGDYAEAARAAEPVPSDFEHYAIYVDDASARSRAGNSVFARTASTSLVVPDAYRELGDPRIPFADGGRMAQDGQLYFYMQQKYPGYDAPIRISSGLEARYIEAEAALKLGDSAPALALIAERRAVGGQPAFGGDDADAILAELMDQRARDFWLEAKHLGDYRRNPSATPYVGAPGAPFYKPNLGEYGELTCIPVPNEERQANPNF